MKCVEYDYVLSLLFLLVLLVLFLWWLRWILGDWVFFGLAANEDGIVSLLFTDQHRVQLLQVR